MQGGEAINAGTVDAKSVSAEIAVAFRDVPRPDRYAWFNLYPYEAERMNYLIDKTWLDVAGDLKHLKQHVLEDFFNMTEECFFYFFPGYLLGVVDHKNVSLESLIDTLLRILDPNPNEPLFGEKQFSYLSARMTPSQKKAVAHWLQLELERDKERCPERYESGAGPAEYEAAFDKWRQWA